MLKTKIIVCSLTLWAGLSASAAVINGGFEQPVLAGTFQNLATGSGSLPGWTVNTAHVLVLTNGYSQAGGTLQFDSHSGNQHLDLTGSGNTGIRSIQQSIATTANAPYVLTFWVGNQDDSRPNYTLASTLNLYVNGAFVSAYANSDDTPNNLNWKQFQYNFLTSSALTNIRFENATPIGDNMLGLDDVSLESAVPEPGSMALLGIGLAAFAFVRRRR